MRRVTTAEFLEWKQHPVTQQLINACRIRIHEGRDAMEEGAIKIDSDQFEHLLRLTAGMCRTYREVLEWKPEFIEEEDPDAEGSGLSDSDQARLYEES